MKNFKRLLVFLLILSLCMSLVTVASAKPDKHGADDKGKETTEKTVSADVQTLLDLGILKGDENGLTYTYTHSQTTRIQGFIIYLRLINKADEAEQFVYKPGGDNFSDHKGNSDYVQKMMAYAKAHPELNWVGSNGRFNPMAHLTAKEYAKILLTALGYQADVDFAWKNVESFAEGLGLNVPKGSFTIEVLATMTVRTLHMTMKNSAVTLIEQLGKTTTADTTKPTVTDTVLSVPYVAGPPAVNGQVTIYFSEAMKAETITNLANYTVDLDGSVGSAPAAPLSSMTGAAAAAAADNKSITLTIPGSALKGGEAAGTDVTTVTISGLKDLAGNTLDTVTTFVRTSSVLSLVSAAATDVNKLQVTFSNPLKTVEPTEFRLYKSDGMTLASVGTQYTLDASGKIVTITLGGALTAAAKAADTDLTTAKLAIGTTNTKDIFGNVVTGAVALPVVTTATPATVLILDKTAPSVSALTKGTAAYTIDLTFTEPVNAVSTTVLSAALQIKNLNGVLQAATYTFAAGESVTGFTKLTATFSPADPASSYSVELLSQGITDMALNAIKAYPKTTVTF